jgi:hypothetical protein
MHARPHGWIEPRLAILRAKDDMKNDFTERLGHGANDDRTHPGSESRFQRWSFGFQESWDVVPGSEMNAAPLALSNELINTAMFDRAAAVFDRCKNTALP